MRAIRRPHVHATTAGGRRRALLAVASLAIPIGLVALPLSPARANLAGSTFEGNDGNLVVDRSVDTDWVDAPHFQFGLDAPSGKNDTSFAGGVSEDTVNPGVSLGAIPNSKDDLARFYTAYEQAGSGSAARELLYLAWVRYKTSGSADMDFELNQSTATAGDGLPARTEGDVLITYEFIATHSPTMSLLRWRTGPGAACYTAQAAPCWADRVTLNSSDSEGAVNDGFSVVDPTHTSSTKDVTLPSQTFGEAAVDLTALGVFSPTRCTKFARVFAKSRSSSSFSSSLQDYVAARPINLSNCLTKTFALALGSPLPAGTTPYAVYTTPDGVTHSLALTGSGSSYSGSDSSIQPGATLTGVHLELRTASGALVWRSSPDQSETINQSTTNNASFSYSLALTPASAENFVGRSHVLTATVTGTGTLNGVSSSAAMTGLPVHFATFNGTPAGCGSLSPTTATTDASGSATSTLTSSTACTTQIRAWVDGTGGTSSFDTGEVSGTASKTFVAYAVTVSPASATNALGTNHTFTIRLTRDTGSGPTGYAGQAVSFAIADPNGTGAYVVSVNGTATSGTSTTSGTCTTSSSGTCTVVATAVRAGTFTLTATYRTTNDSGQGTFTGSGSKSYVDYRVLVTPPSATNEVGVPHTFTAALQEDTGSGFAAASGQTLALALDPGASNAHLVTINGVAASGTSGSCTTRADGTCAVTILATTPGLATLTATFQTTLASGTLTRTGSGTKQYSDFRLGVTPQSAVNPLGVPHTFTVTLQRNDGAGWSGYAAQTVGLSLDPGTTDGHFTSINGVSASGTTGSCTTQSDGTCTATILATRSGTITLTATWSQQLSDSTVTRTASATKSYLALSVSKTSCTGSTPPNGFVDFDIPWSTAGASLTNAKVTDNLPAGLDFVSASPAPTSAPPVGTSGAVVWDLTSPLPDPSSGTIHLVTQADPSVTSGTVLTNTGTFTADGGVSQGFSAAVTVSTAGASAAGRAYGLTASALGTQLVAPTPDTTGGFRSLASLGIPPLAPTVLSGGVGLLDVDNEPGAASSTGIQDQATATTADVNLTVAGVPVTAKAVAAKSVSTATGSSAGSSLAGSEVVGLRVGAGPVQDVSSPTVLDPLTVGTVTLQVSVLEPVGASGAALGGAAGAQPQSGRFQSGLGANGLHIKAWETSTGTVVADVIVSHAESQAAFPTLTPCATATPYLVGSAFVARQDTQVLGPSGVLVGKTTTVVPVLLGSSGGSSSGSANAADLSAIGITAKTATSSTQGTLSPLVVDSDAQVQGLDVANGGTAVITADLVHAHASVNGGATGATIAKLVLHLGTQTLDVCTVLNLPVTKGGLCTPAPNSTLLDLSKTLKIVLNEQLVGQGVTTVNAVHVYVLGDGNPLGLPVGSDLVISSATAGAGG